MCLKNKTDIENLFFTFLSPLKKSRLLHWFVTTTYRIRQSTLIVHLFWNMLLFLLDFYGFSYSIDEYF